METLDYRTIRDRILSFGFRQQFTTITFTTGDNGELSINIRYTMNPQKPVSDMGRIVIGSGSVTLTIDTDYYIYFFTLNYLNVYVKKLKGDYDITMVRRTILEYLDEYQSVNVTYKILSHNVKASSPIFDEQSLESFLEKLKEKQVELISYELFC